MKRLTSFRLHALLLGAVGLVTTAAYIGLRERHSHERDRLAHSAAGERAREIEASWKTLPYTNATQAGVLDAFVAKIDWAGLNLSDLQKNKLQSRLAHVLRYLAAPTLEQYGQLKTEGLRYQFKPSLVAQRILAGHVSNGYEPKFNQKASGFAPFGPESAPVPGSRSTVLEPSIDLDATGLATTRAVWEELSGLSARLAGSRLTGICLEHVVAATSATNSPTALLKGSVRQGWTTATEAVNPGFEYPALPDRPTPAGNRSLFFLLSFFAQTNDGAKAGPVYLCLGWSPEDQEWALCRMLSDSMLGIHILF